MKPRSRVDTCIMEGSQIHAPLKSFVKTVCKESKDFQYVSGTLFLTGDTEKDIKEVVRLVESSMISFHSKLSEDIEQNKALHEGYTISWYIKRLEEIRILNNWISIIGNQYWKREEIINRLF